jgi:hypothetical protein
MSLQTIDDLLVGTKEEVETLIAKAAGLSDHYNQHVADDEGDGHTREPGIHASEVSGCERRIVYSIMNTPRVDKIAPMWRRKFKIGHKIHDMIQADFAAMAAQSEGRIEFTSEVKIHPTLQRTAAKWDIKSSADGLFTFREEKDGPVVARVILEIKSAAPDDFEKTKEPKSDHVEQAHVYMKCLDVPLTWFLYYNKGNENYTPSTNPKFFIRFNPNLWTKLEERFERAHIAAAINELPERTESIKCSFCAFAHECKPAILNMQGRPHKTHTRWRKDL